MSSLRQVRTLTFDAFGTILDLGASHAVRLSEFLKSKHSAMSAEMLWDRWRNRQRLQQYEDNLFCTGHFGYLDSSRRALVYTLRAEKLPFDDADVRRIMEGWQDLKPFLDAEPGFERLRKKFKLVILTNGDDEFTQHVVKHCIRFDFEQVISVDDVGAFKPDPRVYRYAARVLKAEPCELMMVSAHSFDVIGARASAYRAAYINRYDLPFDETPYSYDVGASDFVDLAEKLGC
jgi:2-haloacid dehalogenase